MLRGEEFESHHFVRDKCFCKKLTPSVSAQDPVLEPARITEGILPLWMNRGTFYVFSGLWAKYSFEHPWVTIEDWWERRERNYEMGNAKAKCFCAEFSRDKEKQGKTLADHSLRHEIRRFFILTRQRQGFLNPSRSLLTKSLMLGTSRIIFEASPCPKGTDGRLRLL